MGIDTFYLEAHPLFSLDEMIDPAMITLDVVAKAFHIAFADQPMLLSKSDQGVACLGRQLWLRLREQRLQEE